MGWKGGSWGEDDEHKGMGVGRVFGTGDIGAGDGSMGQGQLELSHTLAWWVDGTLGGVSTAV